MKHGFTLVELAIVLVILGLLIGGILTGQSLIRAAELRSVTTEFRQYQTAVQSFREKYFALPGDMTNATEFWEEDPDGCLTHANEVKKPETCNGNGDGVIGDSANLGEIFRAWQHLANAGLVAGSYTGIAGTEATSSPDHAIIGTNVPASKLSSAGFSFAKAYGATCGSCFPGNYRNYMQFGTNDGGATLDNLWTPILRAEEAWNLDTKVDDGRPGYGSVRARKGTYRPDCTTTDVQSTAKYALTKTAIGCDLMLMLGL